MPSIVFDKAKQKFDNTGRDDKTNILHYFQFMYPTYNFSKNDINYLVFNYEQRLNVVFDVGPGLDAVVKKFTAMRLR